MRKPLLAFKILIACSLVLLCTSAFALDIPRDCSDLEMLQHKWETQYFYDLKFNGYLKNGIPPLKCDSLPYKFVKAIWAIENLKTSPEFGNIYEQLKAHVREFRIMPLIGLPDPVTNNITPIRGNADIPNGKITLYLPAFDETTKKDSYPWKEQYYVRNLMRLASTIVHELRHLQLPEYQHVDCLNGEKKACDNAFTTNIDNATPYSIQMLYLRDILKKNFFNSSDSEQIYNDTNLLLQNSFLESASE